MSVDARLELRSVTAGYGSTTVLRNIDLVAPAGRVTAIIGPNGAGKTTLMRVASGLLRPASGRLLLDGVDLSDAGASRIARHGVCHVPEGHAIFPTLSVRENLRLFARGMRNDPVESAVITFPRLGERLDQIAGTLSGGEQQMLALARTCVTSPRYVLLDEVSMGLAPMIATEIFDFVGRLAASGTALLVVEQYVQKVLEMADLVYVLRKGEVAFVGQPSEIDRDALALEYLGSRAGVTATHTAMEKETAT